MSASGPSGPLVSVNYVPHRGPYGSTRGLLLLLDGVHTRISIETYILLNNDIDIKYNKAYHKYIKKVYNETVKVRQSDPKLLNSNIKEH